MTNRRSIAAPILAVIAILAVPLALYVGCYFWLGNVIDLKFAPNERLRCYRYHWQAALFTPLGRIESAILGRNVVAVYPRVAADGVKEFAIPGQ